MSKVRQWSEWYQISETIILWGLALLLGLTTGVGVWVFKRLIVLTYQIMYTWLGAMLSSIGAWTLFISRMGARWSNAATCWWLFQRALVRKNLPS